MLKILNNLITIVLVSLTAIMLLGFVYLGFTTTRMCGLGTLHQLICIK